MFLYMQLSLYQLIKLFYLYVINSKNRRCKISRREPGVSFNNVLLLIVLFSSYYDYYMNIVFKGAENHLECM